MASIHPGQSQGAGGRAGPTPAARSVGLVSVSGQTTEAGRSGPRSSGGATGRAMLASPAGDGAA